MAGILDLLKKAASTGDSAPAKSPAPDAGIDVGKMAQDSADAAKASQYKGAPYPKTPGGLSSTMTPQISNSKGK